MSGPPYLEKLIVVRLYNPDYGDDLACQCGHHYYRHFDAFDGMRPVGCKYCDCHDFVLAVEK